jgi:heptosyltransferase-2
MLPAGIDARRILVVAPGARFGPAKQYPPSRFAAAAAAIRRQDAGIDTIVVVGAKGDREAASAFRAEHPDCIDLAGRTTLASLIGLLALARGVLANDSGTMHLAAALDVPVIGVFGSTNPAWTHPLGRRAGFVYEPVWCSPCYAPTCAQDFACMLRLPPQRLAAALLERMTMPAPGHV